MKGGEVTLPSGKEDTSIHITQAELIANATNVDTNDRGWLHVQNLTADHGSLVSFRWQFHLYPRP
ncbi:cadherin-like domain-containing protein [Vibrio chagasii]|nr:cadherin-like domain-containing protein [Vibrio chagasii]